MALLLDLVMSCRTGANTCTNGQQLALISSLAPEFWILACDIPSTSFGGAEERRRTPSRRARVKKIPLQARRKNKTAAQLNFTRWTAVNSEWHLSTRVTLPAYCQILSSHRPISAIASLPHTPPYPPIPQCLTSSSPPHGSHFWSVASHLARLSICFRLQSSRCEIFQSGTFYITVPIERRFGIDWGEIQRIPHFLELGMWKTTL